MAILTVLVSPQHSTGTTVIANYLAGQVAKKSNKLTLLIEFNRVASRTLYMQKKTTERRKSLAAVVQSSTTLKDNILKSSHFSDLYFLSPNIYDDFLKLSTYSFSAIDNILTEASKHFDNIVLDLPSNLEEPILGAVLSRNFSHKIDNLLMVLDEDAITYKGLNDFSSFLTMASETEPKYVTYVVNKQTERYIDYIEKSLNLPMFKPLNLVKFPFIPDLLDTINRGTIYALGSGSKAKEFMKSVATLADIVLECKYGVGIQPVLPDYLQEDYNPDASDEEPVKKKGFLGMFSSSGKKKKPAKAKKEKPVKEKKPKKATKNKKSAKSNKSGRGVFGGKKASYDEDEMTNSYNDELEEDIGAIEQPLESSLEEEDLEEVISKPELPKKLNKSQPLPEIEEDSFQEDEFFAEDELPEDDLFEEDELPEEELTGKEEF